MKNAENSSQVKRSHEISLSEALLPLLAKIVCEGRFPALLREVIQFYLKHVAIFKARVLDNNRITIPKEEADILGIQPGDYVAIILTKIER